MEKSSDAFRTISEVADDLDLPQHVLRFWETRFSQIRPLKRAGGRRYYRPADIVVLRTIRTLLYDEGYTIKGVQRVLKDKGARSPADQAKALAPRGPFFESLETAPASEEAAPEVADVGDRRALLRDALTAVEDCMRILTAVPRSSR